MSQPDDNKVPVVIVLLLILGFLLGMIFTVNGNPYLAPGLEDYSAFGLVDFVILPHCDYSDYKEKYEGYKFRKLNDKQELFVSGEEVGLIELEQP